jgi:hypothetical protein
LDSNLDIPNTHVSCVNGTAQAQWPSRVALKPDDKNVVRDSLIDPKKSTPAISSYKAWTDEAVCKGFAERRRVF